MKFNVAKMAAPFDNERLGVIGVMSMTFRISAESTRKAFNDSISDGLLKNSVRGYGVRVSILPTAIRCGETSVCQSLFVAFAVASFAAMEPTVS